MRDDEATRGQAADDREETMRDREQTMDREPTSRDDPRRTSREGWLRAGPADYAAGAADEVTLPPADERREAHDRDIDDPADAAVDPAVLRDGGPTRNRGVATTTGGRRGGPASTRRRPRQPGGKVAPTNTGDATTGKFGTPAGGATSDQSSQANQVGNFTDR